MQYTAEPVNDAYITDGCREYCLHCGRHIRLTPHDRVEDRYWFHAGGRVDCREFDIPTERK